MPDQGGKDRWLGAGERPGAGQKQEEEQEDIPHPGQRRPLAGQWPLLLAWEQRLLGNCK